MKQIKVSACLGMLLALAACCLSGCQRQAYRDEVQDCETKLADRSEDIAELYRDIYESALKENRLETLETAADIAKRLGKYGYSAGDSENYNRFDMVGWEQVEEFCRQAKGGLPACVSIFSVMGNGGFIRFDLESSRESVMVNRSVLIWKDGIPTVSYQNAYPAQDWIYTEEGYLFFDEYTPEGYDGAPAYTAIRVTPLDPVCRSYNQRCIAPVGYGANNLFLHDWTQEDFTTLDFSDLFLLLYPAVMKEDAFWETSYEGNPVQVPAKIFETVILSRFLIDTDDLRAQMDYVPETGSYICAARGFYDAGISPNMPYPEVVDFTQNADQTITLTVNAVLPKQHLSRAFSHEVVIRPMADGGFQYVSNHIIPSTVNTEMWWYTDRLPEKEGSQILRVTESD